jgi:hypothetical protein
LYPSRKFRFPDLAKSPVVEFIFIALKSPDVNSREA